MACFHAIYAYPPPPGAKDRRLVFSAKASYAGAKPVMLPCGKCRGCRLAHAQDWSTRCVHELKFHDASSFLTLTYDDAHLPDDMSVSVRTFQLFMKRLRMEYSGKRLRYFATGENGDRTARPHYHAILYGEDFYDDRRVWMKSKSGSMLYRSERLNRIWQHGEVQIGTVTAQSAGYVARYTMKKLGGAKAEEAYRTVNPVTGEQVQYRPPFLVMSRKPGLGAQWFDKWKSDAFPKDYVIVDGVKKPVPGFYFSLLSDDEKLKYSAARKDAARRSEQLHEEGTSDKYWERLLVREEVLARRTQALSRGLDQEG